MLSQKEVKTIEDIIGDNHLSSSTETPLRKDAFKMSDGDKIKINTEFKIALKDHKIKIPRLLFQNIAEEIEVKVSSVFTKFQE